MKLPPSQPPGEGRAAFVQLVSPRPGHPVSGVIGCKALRGIYLHWDRNITIVRPRGDVWRGKSVVCSLPLERCPYCDLSAKRSWYGYAVLFVYALRKWCMVSIPEPAMCEDKRLDPASGYDLTGHLLTLTRAAGFGGQAVVPQLSDGPMGQGRLIDPPDVEACLCRLFGSAPAKPAWRDDRDDEAGPIPFPGVG